MNSIKNSIQSISENPHNEAFERRYGRGAFNPGDSLQTSDDNTNKTLADLINETKNFEPIQKGLGSIKLPSTNQSPGQTIRTGYQAPKLPEYPPFCYLPNNTPPIINTPPTSARLSQIPYSAATTSSASPSPSSTASTSSTPPIRKRADVERQKTVSENPEEELKQFLNKMIDFSKQNPVDVKPPYKTYDERFSDLKNKFEKGDITFEQAKEEFNKLQKEYTEKYKKNKQETQEPKFADAETSFPDDEIEDIDLVAQAEPEIPEPDIEDENVEIA